MEREYKLTVELDAPLRERMTSLASEVQDARGVEEIVDTWLFEPVTSFVLGRREPSRAPVRMTLEGEEVKVLQGSQGD